MGLDTHGREAALLALTLIREDRTPRGKCCGSSLIIRSDSSQVRVSRFMAPLRHAGGHRECPPFFGQDRTAIVCQASFTNQTVCSAGLFSIRQPCALANP
jgi:hypothetical protein